MEGGGGDRGQATKSPPRQTSHRHQPSHDLGPDKHLVCCCPPLLLPLPMPLAPFPHHRPIGIVVVETAGPLWLAVGWAACGLGRCRVRA